MALSLKDFPSAESCFQGKTKQAVHKVLISDGDIHFLHFHLYYHCLYDLGTEEAEAAETKLK